MRLLGWLLPRLERRHAARWVVALGLFLAAPALAAPLVADEHLQAVRWRDEGLGAFLADAFVFASGEPAEARARTEHIGTWWAAPDFRVAFFRPLSAATHALDLTLFPDGAVPMHAHTLLWLALLLALLGELYRRFLPPRAAVLALALFAWDDARGGLLSWVANRHALIGACFAVAALVAHDRARREGWRAGAVLGPLALLGGLSASESAVATLGFLAGHAVFVDADGSPSRRLARLAPYLLVVVGWQLAYSLGGYGVSGSGSYVHPLEDPLAYLAAVPPRAVALALGQLTFVPSDLWLFYPPAVRVGVVALGGLFLVGAARLVAPRLEGPGARALAVGALVALLPAAAAAPGDRNLTMVGIGAAGALAAALDGLAREVARGEVLPRGTRWVAGLLVASNLVLALVLLPLKCLASFNLDAMRAGADGAVPRGPAIAEDTLVVVSAASEGPVFFAWAYRDAHGIPTPRTRILSTGMGELEVTRLDERTLRLRPDGGFLASEMQRMMRSAARPFAQGDVMALTDLELVVVSVSGDGRPEVVEARFRTPLEAERLRWMRSEGMALVPWSPPAVGETVRVPAPI